jgi:hypothetical protein
MWWNGPPPMWGWGMMIFPFFGILFMVVCLFFMFHMFKGRGSFMSGQRDYEIDDLKREIKGLKEEIVKLQSGREAFNVSKERKDSTCPQTKD